jgi:hypothetical protein
MLTTAGLTISANWLKLAGALKYWGDLAWAIGPVTRPGKNPITPIRAKTTKIRFRLNKFAFISLDPINMSLLSKGKMPTLIKLFAIT